MLMPETAVGDGGGGGVLIGASRAVGTQGWGRPLFPRKPAPCLLKSKRHRQHYTTLTLSPPHTPPLNPPTWYTLSRAQSHLVRQATPSTTTLD